MDEQRPYIIAVKRDRFDRLPADWQERMRRIPGLTVTGASRRRARFLATSEALAQVRAELALFCHVEEELERPPASDSRGGER